MLRLAGLFLVLSGIATLTYQVVWVQLLSLSMGSTSASVSTVLAAFFLGMAAGSLLAHRMTRRLGDHLRAYVVLEVVIGVSGAVLLPVLLALDDIMAWTPAWLGTALWFKLVVSLLLMLVPTMAMGATFPVMASLLIRRDAQLGDRLGLLYSLNTLGAVLGALVSAFLFIPRWGLDGAVWVAVALNAVIVVIAVARMRGLPAEATTDEAVEGAQPITSSPRMRRLALAVLCGTGFVSIAAEVAYTKALAMFLDGTMYGFATILSIFLLGIAIGSWAIKSRLDRIEDPSRWLVAGLLLLGSSMAVSRLGLNLLPWAHDLADSMGTHAGLRGFVRTLAVFGVLLPATLLFGALFPLSLRLYCGTTARLRADVGRAYAANTFASILGAIAAGYVLIPAVGTDSTLLVCAVAVILLAVLLVPTIPAARVRGYLALASVAVLAIGIALPGLDFRALILAVHESRESAQAPEFLFLEEGKAGVVCAVRQDQDLVSIQNNGLQESVRRIGDPAHGPSTEKLLAYLPYLLHEAPKSSFCVGFGGGVTARALTRTDLESIRIVELEPAVVRAVEAALGAVEPLEDPRVQLSFNDARNTLLVEGRTYDIICSQPSHPWRAGAGKLFTREFAALVRDHLNPGGVFCQWCNLVRMDLDTLRSIVRAFFLEFEHGFVNLSLQSGDVLLVGSRSPVSFDRARIEARMGARMSDDLQRMGITGPVDLLRDFWWSRRECLVLTEGVDANTDLRLLSEVRSTVPLDDAEGSRRRIQWLVRSYGADMVPYLQPAEAGDLLWQVGRGLVERQDVVRAKQCAERLQPLDDRLAKRLRTSIRKVQRELEQGGRR
ncbi:MAG: fused MFS/spermidine synthase [Planctomycetes bacterium]|nr:fused MFS/spermidine synthase [Planctomycetota bacterium]